MPNDPSFPFAPCFWRLFFRSWNTGLCCGVGFFSVLLFPRVVAQAFIFFFPWAPSASSFEKSHLSCFCMWIHGAPLKNYCPALLLWQLFPFHFFLGCPFHHHNGLKMILIHQWSHFSFLPFLTGSLHASAFCPSQNRASSS